MSDPLYTTTATVTGGGNGSVSTADGRLELELSVQKELGGDGGPGTNAEQLFAAGYAVCYLQALEGVARLAHVDVGDWTVTVSVGLTGHLDDGMDLTADLEAAMPDVDEETARRLLDEATAACPYTRATRGNIQQDVRLAGSRDG
jgi:osmotically inducible protein OsmC